MLHFLLFKGLQNTFYGYLSFCCLFSSYFMTVTVSYLWIFNGSDSQTCHIAYFIPCFYEYRVHFFTLYVNAVLIQFLRNEKWAYRMKIRLVDTRDDLCAFLYAAVKWIFYTCGATGQDGPTPTQCSNSYRNTNVNVTVGTKGPFKGIQMWRVPETRKYRCTEQHTLTQCPDYHRSECLLYAPLRV